MDHLTALKIFKRVVELESFSSAARDLGYSNAAISKNINELENHLGIRLLQRTTRSMNLTEAGEEYYKRSCQILSDLDEADASINQLSTTPQGNLRVSIPMSIGVSKFACLVPKFIEKYPKIKLDMSFNDNIVNVIADGYDLAVRGRSSLPDSSLIAQKIAPVQRLLCGSPKYFEKNGLPKTPEDLSKHNCLIYSLSSSPDRIQLSRDDTLKTIDIQGNYKVNNSLAIRHALIEGCGIALIPSFIVEHDLRDKTLVPILEDWQTEEQALYAVYPSKEFLPAKVRVFIDFMKEVFAPYN